MTDLDLAAIRERANNATEGPWDNHEGAVGAGDYWLFDTAPSDGTEAGELQRGSDAEFITHARTDIPKLLDALEAKDASLKLIRDTLRDLRTETEAERDSLTARLAAVRELHRQHDCKRDAGRCFIIVSGECVYMELCDTCRLPYPCPTRQAADGD